MIVRTFSLMCKHNIGNEKFRISVDISEQVLESYITTKFSISVHKNE